MQDHVAPEEKEQSARVSLRTLCVAVALVWLVNVWTLHTELRTGSYATGGTPPATAIGGLLLLLLANRLLKRSRRELSRAEMLTIYAFLCIAIPMAGIGIVRAFLPHLTVLHYYTAPENRFDELNRHLPAWLKINDPRSIRQCFEGSPDGLVPWRVWLAPLARWSTFFVAMFAVITSLLAIFRKQWVEDEHLSFPLLVLPLRLLEGKVVGRPVLWRDPVFYVGFMATFAFHGLNLLKATHRIQTAPGLMYSMDPFLVGRPWDTLIPLHLYNMPQIVGLGYFVSLETSFSVWFLYWVDRLVGMIGRLRGYPLPEFPFMVQQSAGGYVALALLLCYVARHHLKRVVRKALWQDPSVDDSHEPLPYRLALLILALAFAYLIVWCVASGMVWWVAVTYLGLIFAFALVYARIRAETGVPYAVLYPLGEPKNLLLDALGATGLVRTLGTRNLVSLSSLSWLSRHYYAEFMAAYQMDGLKLSDSCRLNRRLIVRVMVAAMIAGLLLAFWSHLSAYYRYGENNIDGGGGAGDPRAQVAVMDYRIAESFLWGIMPPVAPHLTSAGAGFLATGLLFVGRSLLTRFPLHPIGYLLATCYGAEGPLWWSFFLVWIVKGLILRYGGMKTYLRLAPAFIGLALGHFFWGGLIWGNVCQLPFIPTTLRQSYLIPRI